ncbi:hypothetical protein LIER_12064 [Lithospermum erythrorhizon]|uniref:BED-type domain-containing protein n=1 Tax=Lithospermum erythrorhizon TaxID=34254 RepID=A0AAV3PUP3_LITER
MEASDEVVVLNSSRLKSVVWNDFVRVKKGDSCLAICRHCDRKLSGSSSSGTSHLRNHLIRCRRSRGNKKDAVTIAHHHYPLARMMILHGYPLSMVDDIGFRVFVRNLQPLSHIQMFDRLEADCKELYNNEKHKLYQEFHSLPARISLSANLWSSNRGTHFLCLAAHYIDDAWNLKKKILNFIPTQPQHLLAQLILSSIRDWDIDSKLFSVTFDNNTAHDGILCTIRDQLCQHKFLLCDGQLFDIRCAAEMVNVMVLVILKNSRQILDKIRESIRYVKSSQVTQAKFNEMIRTVGVGSQRCLCIDNSSQWNSTITMLDTALEYKDVFPLLQEQDPSYSTCPSGKEWERTSAIAAFLIHFLEVTNLFAGIKDSTANTYFADICDVHLQLIDWCQHTDEFVHDLALELKNKFDEYWKKCSLALAIAAILDPRYKMKLVEYYYPQIYGSKSSDCIKIVSECMKALYNSHATYSPPNSHDRCPSSQDRLTGFDRYVHQTSQSQNIKSDLDRYLEEPLFPRNTDFTILTWWRVHTPRYPVLSMMARNILGIPMSKVQSEYAFNIRNRELDSYQSSLSSDILQVLMCTQDWMREELGGSNP